jgi:hypothetical protein
MMDGLCIRRMRASGKRHMGGERKRGERGKPEGTQFDWNIQDPQGLKASAPALTIH